MLRPAPIPDRGVSDATPFTQQPGAFTPPGSMLNTRHRTRRIGKRPGWVKRFQTRIGRGGPVQAVGVITRAAGVSGYSVDQCDLLTAGTSVAAPALTGNLFRLDRVPSMDRAVTFDVTGIGGPAGVSVNACRWSPDGAYIAAAVNYDVAGITRTTIRLFNASTGAVVATRTIAAGTPVFTNTLCFSSEYLVATVVNEIKLYTWAGGTLTPVLTHDLGGWANEAVQAAVWDDGDTEWLYVGFDGASRAGVRTGGTIEAGHAAVHFRSGIMKFRLFPAAALGLGGVAAAQVQFGTALGSGNAFYEAAHGYLRISEPGNSAASPRGCLVAGLAVRQSDGAVALGRTNVGAGPDLATYPPDATAAPRATVALYSAAGALVWERDTDSILEAGFNGDFNDIPFPGDLTPDTSVMAVAFTGAGDVVSGGRETAAGASVYLLRGSDGAVLAAVAVMGAQPESVRQGAVTVDPSDGMVIVCGDRSTDWEGSGGASAHLWKLDPASLAVVADWDVAAAVSALCVDADGNGNLVYGGDFF